MSSIRLVLLRCVRGWVLLLLGMVLGLPVGTFAQATGGLHGVVGDPSGAVIPGADVTLTQGGVAVHAQSAEDGSYSFRGMPAGTYTLGVRAQGFAPFSQARCRHRRRPNEGDECLSSIAVQHQDVTVTRPSNSSA